MAFILDPHNLPFTLSLAIMLGIALLEGVTTLLGFGLSSLLGNFFPSIHVNTDLDPGDIASESSLGQLLSWINVGRIPIMILLVILLTLFALSGYTVQAVSHGLLGTMLPTLLATLIALSISIPMLRVLGRSLGRIMPTDETEVVSEETFIGRQAIITLGIAKKGRPARAKFADYYGTTHLIMVEPEDEADSFAEGDVVLLSQRLGSTFSATRPSWFELEKNKL